MQSNLRPAGHVFCVRPAGKNWCFNGFNQEAIQCMRVILWLASYDHDYLIQTEFRPLLRGSCENFCWTDLNCNCYHPYLFLHCKNDGVFYTLYWSHTAGVQPHDLFRNTPMLISSVLGTLCAARASTCGILCAHINKLATSAVPDEKKSATTYQDSNSKGLFIVSYFLSSFWRPGKGVRIGSRRIKCLFSYTCFSYS